MSGYFRDEEQLKDLLSEVSDRPDAFLDHTPAELMGMAEVCGFKDGRDAKPYRPDQVEWEYRLRYREGYEQGKAWAAKQRGAA